MTDAKTKKLIKRAIRAIDKEIEAVREKPSHEVLFNGHRREAHPQGVFHYEFDTKNTSMRYAEVIRGELHSEEDDLELYTVENDDDSVVLEFPHNVGAAISQISLEWENDFILKQLKWQLDTLLEDAAKSRRKRVAKLFEPDGELHHHPDENTRVIDDGRRNNAQHQALIKSLQNEVLFVWGPPGTGKTATLGYMMANFLVKNKRVLFASNTNRAVDVGLLSLMEALRGVEKDHLEDQITRYGEIALDSDRLEQRSFARKLEQERANREQQAASLKHTLDRYKKLQSEIDNLQQHGEAVPQNLDDEINELGDTLDAHGGPDAAEEEIDELLSIDEREQLRGCSLVGTTLAKVCTSELFMGLQFDVVVIDEASMANLPYLMVLAAKARDHIILVGDPMQLPPIAVTNHRSSRDFLENDIFSYVSDAETTDELFAWHDANLPLNTFFDTQYRMNQDLADVLSTVFYQGRLQTAEADAARSREVYNAALEGPAPTVNVINTTKYGTYLQQKDEGRGFSPVNKVHQQLLVRILHRLVKQNMVPMDAIGVIVPFRSTVYDLRGLLYDEGYPQIEVGTIHTFQGREKQVIIFDTVMSGEQQRGRRRHYSVRPFDEDKNGLSVPRLLNVAFSRSKQRLVILADMDHINRMYGEKYLGRLLQRFQQSEAG